MHELISHNFRWKAVSLGLAVIVWFVIKFDATAKPTYSSEFTVPVLVLADPAEKRLWHLSPAEAHVRVLAPLGIAVAKEDIVAFVNLTEASPTTEPSQGRRIRVDVPAGVEVAKVDPVSVIAQYSTLPADSRTNRVPSP